MAAAARHGRSDYTAPFRPEQDTWQLGYLLAMNMKPVAWSNALSEGLKCQIFCAAAETNIKNLPAPKMPILLCRYVLTVSAKRLKVCVLWLGPLPLFLFQKVPLAQHKPNPSQK